MILHQAPLCYISPKFFISCHCVSSLFLSLWLFYSTVNPGGKLIHTSSSKSPFRKTFLMSNCYNGQLKFTGKDNITWMELTFTRAWMVRTIEHRTWMESLLTLWMELTFTTRANAHLRKSFGPQVSLYTFQYCHQLRPIYTQQFSFQVASQLSFKFHFC